MDEQDRASAAVAGFDHMQLAPAATGDDVFGDVPALRPGARAIVHA